MALVTQDPILTAVGALVSFLTVARASATRMLDAPLGMVSSWADGQPLYTSSFGGADWHWQADVPAGLITDNETTCRPTSWIAGGLPGAAVRSLSGNPFTWKQNAWRVDSTAADNEGTGGALDPVKNDFEIQRRWGVGVRAQLADSVVITYAQTPTNQTAYLFQLVPGGGRLQVFGTPTISKAGTVLTAVRLQVRTAGAEAPWAITAPAFGATDVDKIVVITASAAPGNVTAYAKVVKDETAGVLRVSPFGTFNAATGAYTQVTPLVGDTVEMRDMTATTLTFGKFEGHSLLSGTAQNPTVGVTFDSLHLASIAGAGFQGALHSLGLGFYYARCTFGVLRVGGLSSNMPTQHFWRGGGIVTGGSVTVHASGILSCSQIGANGSLSTRTGGILILDADCYFQNANVVPGSVAGGAVSSTGVAFFDRSTASAALTVIPGSTWRQTGAVPDWGTANAGYGLFVQSAGNYCYATKPTINGTLGVGREASIGGTDKLYGAVPYVEGANNAALVLTA